MSGLLEPFRFLTLGPRMESWLYWLRLKRAKEVLRVGHPLLRVKATRLHKTDLGTPKLQNAINDMKSVFNSPYHPVLGLAAPQVGHGIQLIAFRFPDPRALKDSSVLHPMPLTFIINPELEVLDSRQIYGYESCESFPNYNAVVRRAARVRVTGVDLEWTGIEIEASGFFARVLQHEVDHLEGLTIADKMEKQSLRHDKYIGKFDVPFPKVNIK
ncbi:hypothetical protein HDU96_003872 [Phlyctochytrium bullatum]|nr:hypothetical protein HDU96_003872 [Phlyctochytrium bullatum]